MQRERERERKRERGGGRGEGGGGSSKGEVVLEHLRSRQISTCKPYMKHTIATSLVLIRPFTRVHLEVEDAREQV